MPTVFKLLYIYLGVYGLQDEKGRNRQDNQEEKFLIIVCMGKQHSLYLYYEPYYISDYARKYYIIIQLPIINHQNIQ
jgi:hypothetical protein